MTYNEIGYYYYIPLDKIDKWRKRDRSDYGEINHNGILAMLNEEYPIRAGGLMVKWVMYGLVYSQEEQEYLNTLFTMIEKYMEEFINEN